MIKNLLTISILLAFLFVLKLSSNAQGLAPIPDVGEGVCVTNCGGGSDDTLPDSSSTSIAQLSIILDNLKAVPNLEKEAIQKIKQKQFAEAGTLINNSIDVLTQSKTTLLTDPELEEFRNEDPKLVSKITRFIDKSLSSLEKASELIVRSNTETVKSLISKLLKSAKKHLIQGRRHTVRAIAVAGVRG